MQQQVGQALALLVQSGALDEASATACAREADASGESPLTCAIRRGLLTPAQVTQALASVDRAHRSGPVRVPGSGSGARAPRPSTTPRTTPDPPPRDGPSEPQRFGPYEIVRRLGEGGMGVVYEAIDSRLGRAVALKVLAADRKVTEATHKRFEREAKVVARLSHPNVCAVHDAGEVGGRAYFTMDLVRGQSLDCLIAATKGLGLPWDRACRIVRDAARGLAHAHEEGIVHRDVKPSNILVTQDGRALVVDFGLASDEDSEERLTRTGQLLGTPVYMAPERFGRSFKDAGPAVDIYSLGATLYEALSGQAPFAAANVLDLVSKIKRGTPPPPRASEGCPPAVQAICLRALATAPERRHASAEALADDLDRVLAGDAGLAGGGGAGAGDVFHAFVRQRPGLALACLAALLVLAVAIGVALGKSSVRPPVVASPTPAASPPGSSPTPVGVSPAPLPTPVPTPTPAKTPPPPTTRPVSQGPPRTVEEALERARSYLWDGDFDAAETAYRTAQQLEPENADAGLECALVGNLLQEPRAGGEVQRLLVLHPEHTIARVYAEIANAALGQERSKKLEKRIAESPISPLIRVLRGQSLADADERKAELRAALAARPECGYLATQLAQELVDDSPEKALALLDEPRRYEGVAASFRAYARAVALGREKRWGEADAALALVQGPPVVAVMARGQRAVLAIDRGDAAAAVAVHEGREPGALDDRVALARALVALERDKEARAVLDLAVKVARQGGDTLGIYRAAGASEADIRLVTLAQQLVAKTDRAREIAAVRGRRARLAARAGDLATAQADVEEMTGEGYAAERRATKGTIALVKGDAAEAERLFAKALEPPVSVEADVYLDRATALEKTGDVAGAIGACKAAIKADPMLKAAATAQLARLEKAKR